MAEQGKPWWKVKERESRVRERSWSRGWEKAPGVGVREQVGTRQMLQWRWLWCGLGRLGEPLAVLLVFVQML